MKLAACFLVLSAGVCSAAPADEPQSPAQTPAAESPAVQTSTQTTSSPATVASATASTSEVKQVQGAPAVPAPKADKSEAANGVPTEAEIKQMRGRGYKPVNRNGMLVFCRDEGELGSHFQRTRCNTLKELKDAELRAKEYVNSVQRSADPFKGP
jgi:cell pole-organizing protein PopZ